MPGPVMNSLVSDTKVVCNDSIPNPIAPVPIPITIPTDKDPKKITLLNGTHLKIDSSKRSQNSCDTNGDISDASRSDNVQKDGSSKEETSMNTDTSNELSNESSLSPSEPMDCNSTPNISPAHVGKLSSSNEDVAMSDNLVGRLHRESLFEVVIFVNCRRPVEVCRLRVLMLLTRWLSKVI